MHDMKAHETVGSTSLRFQYINVLFVCGKQLP